jgi:signal transduction histidine kinase
MNSPVPVPSWPERRRNAEADCERAASDLSDTACAERVRSAATDPKWEVRKVVAEALAEFPEPLFRELSVQLAGDSNSMVQHAAKRSIARRSPATALSASHPTVIQAELDRIERRFGADARKAAFRFAERTVALHVRTAVHDIKNILTHFNIDTTAIAKCATSARLKARLERFENGRAYLKQLVERMEMYSREPEITPQAEDLVELLAESVAAARDQVRAEGKPPDPVECEIRSPSSFIVPVSRFDFAMVLTNLIKNAIQSHAVSESELRSGKVLIEMQRTAPGVQIAVKDTGRGIAPGDLRKLLDFVPGGSSKPGGMGYGLPTCRKYVEAHGGELKMRSEESVGTEVIVSLPINSSDERHE